VRAHPPYVGLDWVGCLRTRVHRPHYTPERIRFRALVPTKLSFKVSSEHGLPLASRSSARSMSAAGLVHLAMAAHKPMLVLEPRAAWCDSRGCTSSLIRVRWCACARRRRPSRSAPSWLPSAGTASHTLKRTRSPFASITAPPRPAPMRQPSWPASAREPRKPERQCLASLPVLSSSHSTKALPLPARSKSSGSMGRGSLDGSRRAPVRRSPTP
jgi:hypothetical protein